VGSKWIRKDCPGPTWDYQQLTTTTLYYVESTGSLVCTDNIALDSQPKATEQTNTAAA